MSEAAAVALERELYDLPALVREQHQPVPPRRELTEADIRQLMADRIEAVPRTQV